jgi:hypothetical protein
MTYLIFVFVPRNRRFLDFRGISSLILGFLYLGIEDFLISEVYLLDFPDFGPRNQKFPNFSHHFMKSTSISCLLFLEIQLLQLLDRHILSGVETESGLALPEQHASAVYDLAAVSLGIS